MTSFANDIAYQNCTSNLPEKFSKKMVVFGKTIMNLRLIMLTK